MPDVFISYSREDKPIAELIASSLEAEGFSVWWDAVLRAGDSYDEVIEDNLRSASAVVVLWSATSTKSKWVRAEATAGERHSTLVPALIEDCDRPLRFEMIQSAELTAWRGDRNAPNWKSFVADISAAVGETRSAKTTPAAQPVATAPIAALPRNPTPDDSIEAIFWSTIKDTNEPAELEAYLKRYKNGHFVDLAQGRLASLAGEAGKPAARKATQAAPMPVAAAPGVQSGVPQPLIAIALFMVTTIIGVIVVFAANAIDIGWFTWTPAAGAKVLDTGSKEVGFFLALNWSVTALLLMPLAWTLIYLALSEASDAWTEMARRRMLVTADFTPVDAAHPNFLRMQNHIRLFVLGGITGVTALMLTLAYLDYAQVAGSFYGDAAEMEKFDRLDDQGYPLSQPDLERDWMVASFLSSPGADPVDAGANRAFSLAAYLIYVGIGIGSLLSFGLVIIGLGATFMRGIAQNYGLLVIPDLTSDDRRCGFEVVRRFFTFAIVAALIGCVMIYLMGIQNIYLRSPAESIFAFLTPDMAAFNDAANWRDNIDALFGFLFSESVAKGTRNIYVWFFGFLIFAVFIGGFMLFLRQGALLGKSLILDEMRANGFERLQKLTHKDEETVTDQLAGLHIWPLEQPDLRASLGILLLMIASFIFYKLGVVIVLGLCLATPFMLLRSSGQIARPPIRN